MSIQSWNEFATVLAVYARKNLSSVHRAAMMIPLSINNLTVAVVFGNDNYGADGKARWEVDLVRQWLKNTGIEELGFGLSADSHTWALLVRADSQHYQTDVGRAFQMEMLKASLDDALRGAWRTACELARNPGAQPAKEHQLA
jgi:hypothetical protein